MNQQSKSQHKQPKSVLNKTTNIKKLDKFTTHQDIRKNSNSIQIMKKYLLKKTENYFKQHLSDEQAFKWKFHQNKNNQILSTFKLLKCQTNQVKTHSETQVTLNDLRQYSFPVLKYKTIELVDFGVMIIKENSYFKKQFEGDENFLKKLIHSISLNYNIVSYHNFSHAFSLSLVLYQCFEYHKELNKYFTDEEKFYAIIAGYSHDLNHPGTNNLYEVKLKTKLALQANNEAVLEKFHVQQLWKILKNNPDVDFLKKIPNSQKIKEKITYLILMTDVAQHFKNMERLKAFKLQALTKGSASALLDSQSNRQFFLGQLFHACDISNPCVDFDNYITWGALLSYEFNEQTKLQKQNQVQVTEMLRYKDLTTFYKGQLGFINFLVMPLWKQIGQICENLSIFTNNINENIKILNKMIETATQQDEKIDNMKF